MSIPRVLNRSTSLQSRCDKHNTILQFDTCVNKIAFKTNRDRCRRNTILFMRFIQPQINNNNNDELVAWFFQAILLPL